MSRDWRLTRRAAASLRDIAQYTYDTFGPRQADAYGEDLIDLCAALARGTAQGQDCSALVGADRGRGLRHARAGSHFIIYLDRADMLIVVEFLHQRSDLPRHLARLADTDPRA